ncbi:hypothetical protein COUCH_32655 [Couchioplanes caeruleus]|uniref:hypothetical protein n=1 Tax=Couchioplanes caeruleus TaxID=56438 RepID=UPI0020C0A033|nr:hypothetical protein [Couchioplanes caeruleus]UQU63697.1 hypothetical protein COUCH_32655 [Couchioplanes caeruleus]
MNVRKVRLAGFGALLALGAVSMGGCGVADTVEEAAPATPEDTLMDALPDFSTGPFHFTVKGGTQPMTGVLDAGRKSYRIDVSQKDPELGFTLTMKFLVVREKSWIKVDFKGTDGLTGLPKLPKKWLLVDPAEVKDTEDAPLSYDDETDPGEAGAVLRAIVDVKQTGTGTYEGTTDLTKQGEAGIVEDSTLKALGDRAKAVPFEATVDAQGRLTRTVVEIPSAGKVKAARYEVVYDQYGSAGSPAEPAAAEQQKAPKAAYEMLNA